MYNVRDLGGFATKDGQITAFGRFLRADAPVRLDADDLHKLLDYPVRTVIDLRCPNELNGLPYILRDQPNINYFHIPLLGPDLDKAMASVKLIDSNGEKVGLPDLYIHLLEHSQNTLGQVFKCLANADPNGASLFHCSHGKDRTGLVAALLLLLAGVADKEIIDNYQISYTFLKPWFDTFINTVPTGIRHYFNTNPQNMVITLSYFHQHFQSAEAYLGDCCGVSCDEIAGLKRRLLEAE